MQCRTNSFGCSHSLNNFLRKSYFSMVACRSLPSFSFSLGIVSLSVFQCVSIHNQAQCFKLNWLQDVSIMQNCMILFCCEYLRSDWRSRSIKTLLKMACVAHNNSCYDRVAKMMMMMMMCNLSGELWDNKLKTWGNS